MLTLPNIVPQDGDNNRNLWEVDLYIITGPIFDGAQLQQINNRVMVPTRIFKAIYDPKRNQAAAYLVENKPGMDYTVISIAELEKITGINLFPDLTDNVKNYAMDLPAPHLHSSSNKKHHHHNNLSPTI